MGLSRRKKAAFLLTGALLISQSKCCHDLNSENALRHLYNLSGVVVTDDAFNFLNNPYSMTSYASDIDAPINDGMVPQGLTICDNLILTSSYDYNKESNSYLNIALDNGECLGTIDLKIKAHVGGIAYDKSNNLLWVANKGGYISSYNIEDLLDNYEVNEDITSYYVGKGCHNFQYPWLEAISFITVDEDYLYAGSFEILSSGRVNKFKIINKDENINLEYISSFKIPTKVQGFTFYKKDDNKYILFSRSFGKDSPSILQIFKYDEDIKDYSLNSINSVSYEMPAMMEEIVVKNDELYVLYESAALPYNKDGSKDKIDILDMNLLLKP